MTSRMDFILGRGKLLKEPKHCKDPGRYATIKAQLQVIETKLMYDFEKESKNDAHLVKPKV